MHCFRAIGARITLQSPSSCQWLIFNRLELIRVKIYFRRFINWQEKNQEEGASFAMRTTKDAKLRMNVKTVMSDCVSTLALKFIIVN